MTIASKSFYQPLVSPVFGFSWVVALGWLFSAAWDCCVSTYFTIVFFFSKFVGLSSRMEPRILSRDCAISDQKAKGFHPGKVWSSLLRGQWIELAGFPTEESSLSVPM